MKFSIKLSIASFCFYTQLVHNFPEVTCCGCKVNNFAFKLVDLSFWNEEIKSFWTSSFWTSTKQQKQQPITAYRLKINHGFLVPRDALYTTRPGVRQIFSFLSTCRSKQGFAPMIIIIWKGPGAFEHTLQWTVSKVMTSHDRRAGKSIYDFLRIVFTFFVLSVFCSIVHSI